MADTLNPYYHAKGVQALRAFLANTLNLNGRSSRSEYWWLLPWYLLYLSAATRMTLTNHAWFMVLEALILLPMVTLTARRVRDAGLPGWLGAAACLDGFATWQMALNMVNDHSDALLFEVWFLLIGGAVWLAKTVITLLPTHQKKQSSRSELQLAYRTQHKLSADDLKLFQQTMGTAKDQILAVQKAAGQSAEVGAILKDTGGLHAAQEIFRELMAHPHELTTYDEFLYRKLPALVTAAQRVVEIQAGRVQSAKVTASVQEMMTSISAIAASITADYEQIVTEDAADIALNQKEVPHG